MIERYRWEKGGYYRDAWDPKYKSTDNETLSHYGWKLIYRIGTVAGCGAEGLHANLYISEQADGLRTEAAEEGDWLVRIYLGEFYRVADVVCATGWDLLSLLRLLQPLQAVHFQYFGFGGR